jgi:succinylglutamate desuccinylase
MNTNSEYQIVSAGFHGNSATHANLAEQVQKLIKEAWEPLGAPFLGPEAMYQAMVRGQSALRGAVLPPSAVK